MNQDKDFLGKEPVGRLSALRGGVFDDQVVAR